MRILLFLLLFGVLSQAKISSAIESAGVVSISDILPNIAVRNQSSQLVIKGSGFTPNTKVIITPDTTHEILRGDTYPLAPGLAAQSSYVYGDKLYVGYGNDSATSAGILVYSLSNDAKTPEFLYDNNETNLTFVNSLSIKDNTLYVSDDRGLFTYNIDASGALVYVNSYLTNSPLRNVKFTDTSIVTTFSPDNTETNSTTGLLIFNYDLDTPTQYNTAGSSWSVDIDNEYAYIADGDNGLVILSLSDGSQIAHYPALSVHSVAKSDNYIFLGKFTNGIEVVDISDLSNIQSVDTLATNGKSHKIKLVDDKLIVANVNDGVLVLDVKDPTDIKEFAKFNAPGDTYSADTYGNYGYSANGFNGIVINDLSTPNNISDMILSSQSTEGYAKDIVVEGNNTYFSYSLLGEEQGGIVVTDISNLEQPKYKTSYRPLAKVILDTTSLSITKLVDVNFSKELIDLQNVDFVADTNGDGFLDSNKTLTSANQLFIKDSKIYVADTFGLVIYDAESNVSLGSMPTWDAYYDEVTKSVSWYTSPSKSIQVVENINIEGTLYKEVAVLATGDGSVALFDVTTPSNIKIIYDDVLTQNWGINEIHSNSAIVKDEMLYIATDNSYIIDINLTSLTSYNLNQTAPKVSSIVFDNGYAYISAGYDGLIIADENNLANIISTYNTPDFAWFTSIRNGIAYIADSYTGIVMLDISNKALPTYLDTLKVSGETKKFDFLDSQSALLVSSTFGGIVTLDTYLDTNVSFIDKNTLEITFPDYRILGDYTLKVLNDNENYSRIAGAITLISEIEKTTMSTVEIKNNLQLRTKDGKDGIIVINSGKAVILNALMSYGSTITNVFKELSGEEYQMTSSDNSIAQVYGDTIVFNGTGRVTITLSAKGLSDSITFNVIDSSQTILKNDSKDALIILGHIDDKGGELSISNPYDPLRFSINKIGNNIYKTLSTFGLDASNIHYFNPNGEQELVDEDNDKRKDNAVDYIDFTWDDIVASLHTLDSNSSEPLIFWMVDHGDKDMIKISANISVTTTQIKTAIDEFQTKTGRTVIAIIDACYSGTIANAIQADNRIIISSADDITPTYMDPYGISFSSYFLKYLKRANGIKTSFDITKEIYNKVLASSGVSINPSYSNLYSIYTNSDYKLSDFNIANGEPTFINYTGKDSNITLASSLELKVITDHPYPPLAKLYALISPAGAVENVGTARIIKTELIELVVGSDNYSKAIYNFDENETYKVTYMLKDDDENAYLSETITINEKEPIITPEYTQVLNLHNGWNLVSLDMNITELNALSDIEILWQYNNDRWSAYSPLEDIQSTILTQTHIDTINAVNSSQGTWILSGTEQSIYIKDTLPSIQTYTQGWNLVGASQVVDVSTIECESSSLSSVWKYTDESWLLYTDTNNSFGLASFTTINVNEGFWVDCQ